MRWNKFTHAEYFKSYCYHPKQHPPSQKEQTSHSHRQDFMKRLIDFFSFHQHPLRPEIVINFIAINWKEVEKKNSVSWHCSLLKTELFRNKISIFKSSPSQDPPTDTSSPFEPSCRGSFLSDFSISFSWPPEEGRSFHLHLLPQTYRKVVVKGCVVCGGRLKLKLLCIESEKFPHVSGPRKSFGIHHLGYEFFCKH